MAPLFRSRDRTQNFRQKIPAAERISGAASRSHLPVPKAGRRRRRAGFEVPLYLEEQAPPACEFPICAGSRESALLTLISQLPPPSSQIPSRQFPAHQAIYSNEN